MNELFEQIIFQQQATTFSSVIESIGVGIAAVISAVVDPIFQLVSSSK
ncbi:hypothetical protein [Corynebacterium sp.]|nr:hypothetical protein [Corynebacterium sp.]